MPPSKGYSWRNTLGGILTFLGIVLGFIAAGFWAHFIWSFDWAHDFGSISHQRRNWNFGLVMLISGTPIVFSLIFLFFTKMADEIKSQVKQGTDAAKRNRDWNWALCTNADPDIAISGCTAVIESGEETTEGLAIAFSNRGIALNSKGQYKHAIQDYDEAIALHPNRAGTFCNRGNSYLRMAQYDRAIEDYSRALGLDSNYVDAIHNRGVAKLRKGDTAGGNADITEAKQLSPNVGS